MEPESLAPPVFISYQWDAQEVVLNIRQHLEFSGFPCWMDVGQVGGGDSLYGKIYEGISRAKVVLCCLTPRYASSSSCARELSLADVLRKPIVPGHGGADALAPLPVPWPWCSARSSTSTCAVSPRVATPSPRPSQANAARNDDERELQSAASVPMDDDRESDASNPGSPQSWDRPNRVINRVVRCSICAII
ncbi:hypothetical protein MTO96_004995 [Rhipicephalus appendiculatus]